MLVRGTLLNFDAGSQTASVRYAGSRSTVVAGIPVSRAIPAGELAAGRRVAVALFDAGHPSDAMVLGVF